MAGRNIRFACYDCGRPASSIYLIGNDPYLDVPVCSECEPTADVKLPQVGEKMLDACLAVSGNEGCSKIKVARMIEPSSPLKRGFRALNRAIDARLIKTLKTDGGYQLFLTRLGWALLRDRM